MKQVLKKMTVAGMLLSGTLLLSACSKDGNNNNGNTARVDFRLTDAPGTYESVLVDVQEIRVHTDVNGWETLPLIRPGVYNLLDLNNGIDTLMCHADLPVGKISQIRLILGANNSIVDNNIIYPLETPSAMQSGLKFNVHQDLEAGKAYTMWLDFDAGKSIVKTGDGDYKLKPVVRAYTDLTNGSIEGTVLPLAANAYVYAVNGANDTFTAIPNFDGYFKFCGLPEGTYEVVFDADDLTPYVDFTMTGVSVTFGNITSVGNVVLAF